MRHGTV